MTLFEAFVAISGPETSVHGCSPSIPGGEREVWGTDVQHVQASGTARRTVVRWSHLEGPTSAVQLGN